MNERQQSSAGEREAVRHAARDFAYDWYLAALLAPQHARDDLVTLAAYAGEIARVPLTVSEPGLGAIRLQWWRDAVASGGGDGPGDVRTGNPVADRIAELARRHALPIDLLERPLAGYERELVADGFEDEAAFETYLDETWGTAFHLGARALGAPDTAAMRSLCKLAAAAYGRTRLALDLPRYLARGRLPLPAARLAGHDPRDLPEIEARPAARALVAMLAKEAREALAEARTGLRAAPRPVRPAFLPLALVEPYLRALEDPGHDPLHEITDISPLVRVAKLWLANRRGGV
jgi:phytoene synthase